LNDNIAQQQSPSTSIDSLQKFEQNEAGFITKSGCRINPLVYYCLSDGRYYFAVDDKKNYYYIDTAEVLAFKNIEIGKDQRFSAKKNAGFARRLWLGTVIVGGPIGVAMGGGAFFLFGATVVEVPDPFDYDGGGFFVAGLAVGATIFYKVLKSAIQNVHEHNAYKKAQHYVCN
jgi:hypothetical protein